MSEEENKTPDRLIDVPEAVGVFDDVESLQQAVYDLWIAGFSRFGTSLLTRAFDTYQHFGRINRRGSHRWCTWWRNRWLFGKAYRKTAFRTLRKSVEARGVCYYGCGPSHLRKRRWPLKLSKGLPVGTCISINGALDE